MKNLKEAISLLEENREAVLATLESDQPLTSAVGYLYQPPEGESGLGKIVLLASDLARHTKNIRRHERVSLMVLEAGDKPVYEKQRVAVQGVAHVIKQKEKIEIYRRE